MTLTFKVKFNLKNQNLPHFEFVNLSTQLVTTDWNQDFQISTKIYLSTVKVPIDFGLDWPWSSVSFLISNLCFSSKLCVYYSFASVCIYQVKPSPVNAPHSTCMDSYMHVDRVLLWFVKHPSLISWWDHRSSMGRRLGDWRLALDFISFYRFSPIYTHLTWRNFIYKYSATTETTVKQRPLALFGSTSTGKPLAPLAPVNMHVIGTRDAQSVPHSN